MPKHKHKLNPIPRGGTIVTPKLPVYQTSTSVCDNGSRKVKRYYKDNFLTNVFGEKIKYQKKCNGCYGHRCSKLYNNSKINNLPKINKKNRRKCNDYYICVPKPILYYTGPLTTI